MKKMMEQTRQKGVKGGGEKVNKQEREGERLGLERTASW